MFFASSWQRLRVVDLGCGRARAGRGGGAGSGQGAWRRRRCVGAGARGGGSRQVGAGARGGQLPNSRGPDRARSSRRRRRPTGVPCTLGKKVAGARRGEREGRRWDIVCKIHQYIHVEIFLVIIFFQNFRLTQMYRKLVLCSLQEAKLDVLLSQSRTLSPFPW
jgi:hypothetical protein